MKTVSGRVVSTQPISLSRAAKWISKFTASDNEASPAFSAYLKRTSAAFNELVQLHKENNILLGDFRNKKDCSSGFITLGTPNSIKVTDVGLSVDNGTGNLNYVSKKSKKKNDQPSGEHDVTNEIGNRHGSEDIKKIVPDVGGSVGKKSKKKRESDVSEVKNKTGNPNAIEEIEEMKNDLPDVGDVDKKSRKKKGTDDHVLVTDNDQSHHAINANVAKDEMRSPNANGELKKKKKKIDKFGKENPDVGLVIVQKSKVKELKETEQKDDGNVMEEGKEERETKVDDACDGKKHKKKRSHELDIRDNGCSVEKTTADKKANRKRKHDRVADGELDGSHEAVRAKKKKIQPLK